MTPPNSTSATQRPLIDPFARRITYLRLSVTDRCDYRCLYCMGPDQRFTPREDLLTLAELARVGAAFVELGVTKIRLTGGEPLVRPDISTLAQTLNRLPGLAELALTTNGSQLVRLAPELRAAGVKRLNISLDTLRAERFKRITRSGDLSRVQAGIDAAAAAGFERVKLNAVILKNRNHDEVVDLVRFAIERDINISFIEEMPLGSVAGHDRAESFYSSAQIRADLEPHFSLIPTTETSGGPARYFRIPDSETRVGFISPHSHNFCGDCNRVRVTAEGRLLLCLGQERSLDLRAILRDPDAGDEVLKQHIVEAMQLKPLGHDLVPGIISTVARHMNHTGG